MVGGKGSEICLLDQYPWSLKYLSVTENYEKYKNQGHKDEKYNSGTLGTSVRSSLSIFLLHNFRHHSDLYMLDKSQNKEKAEMWKTLKATGHSLINEVMESW